MLVTAKCLWGAPSPFILFSFSFCIFSLCICILVFTYSEIAVTREHKQYCRKSVCMCSMYVNLLVCIMGIWFWVQQYIHTYTHIYKLLPPNKISFLSAFFRNLDKWITKTGLKLEKNQIQGNRVWPFLAKFRPISPNLI